MCGSFVLYGNPFPSKELLQTYSLKLRRRALTFPKRQPPLTPLAVLVAKCQSYSCRFTKTHCIVAHEKCILLEGR